MIYFKTNRRGQRIQVSENDDWSGMMSEEDWEDAISGSSDGPSNPYCAACGNSSEYPDCRSYCDKMNDD